MVFAFFNKHTEIEHVDITAVQGNLIKKFIFFTLIYEFSTKFRKLILVLS